MARFRDQRTGQYWRQALRGDVMRVYHDTDVACTGASVSLKEFGQKKEPPPLVTTQQPPARRPARPVIETYPCPDVGRLVALVQAGELLPPLTPASPTTHALACGTCRRVSGCRCGVPTPGGLDAIVAMQRQQGKRH